MALPDLFLISSPVMRGRTKEGESPKGDLPDFRSEIGGPATVARPLLYPPPYDGGGGMKDKNRKKRQDGVTHIN